jgi:cytoskeleton protein RodZ
MPETIGQQLKQARETRYLTLNKVTEATHIQTRLIEAMEADDFESLPSPVQARAFLRLYAEFLGLSLDDLIARQRLSIEESPAAFLNTLSVPGQSQPPGEAAGIAPASGPVRAARTGKMLPRLQEMIMGVLMRIRQSLPQPKKTLEPLEPADQEPPSKPERITIGQVEADRMQVKAPVQDLAEGPFPPGRALSESRSQGIFTNIGEALQKRRESLSLTFDEIEHHTHIRSHYLQALEVGDFDHLPSSVQTRGMLNGYARFLDMDVEAILMQFAEGLQAQRLERQPAPVIKPKLSKTKSASKTVQPPGLQRYLSMDVIIGVGLILVLLVFAIWGTSRIIGLRSASTPQPTAQSISDILAAATVAGSPTPLPTNPAGTGAVIPEVSSTPIVVLPVAGQGPVQVVLVALEQAFVRVTVDGKKLFEGRVVAGTAYPYDGNTQIEILTGNGAAVSILFNQSDLGPMGSVGQVVDRIYTAKAILNPTATSTPTATITLIHSLTPTPTLTPTLTPRTSSTPPTPVSTP